MRSDEFTIKKVLIDPGATLNLIPIRVVNKMNMIRFEDSTMSIQLANGEKVK